MAAARSSSSTEYQRAGADIVDSVASRANGMRDFVVRDPDGHRFTLGRGEERLREVSGYYGLHPDGSGRPRLVGETDLVPGGWGARLGQLVEQPG